MSFSFLLQLRAVLKTDLIKELFPFPLAPHNNALLVKFPLEKLSVFSRRVFF